MNYVNDGIVLYSDENQIIVLSNDTNLLLTIDEQGIGRHFAKNDEVSILVRKVPK